MLHYKKSRHNLYEHLDYLGLNSYEQRHFCFEGAGSGEGGESEAGGFDSWGGGSEAEGGQTGDPEGIMGFSPSGWEAGIAGANTGLGGGRGDDPRAHGFDPVEDARSKSQAQQQSYQDMMDDLYNKAGHISRAKTYTDFFGVGNKEGKVGGAKGFLSKDPNLFATLLDQYDRKGYAPRGVVLNTHGVPVETTWGYLTQEDPEEEEYENRRSRRELYLLPYKKSSVPGMDMLMDPVIQDVMFSPEPAYDNRRYYTEAVREASQAMTPEERYGVLDPTIAFDDPRYGTRIGGYLPTLEQSGLPTYMGGFRGSRETDAPFALTSAEADRYQEIFMAFDGTRGGAIRAEIDSAKPGQTVDETLTEAGLSSYGLPKEAEASSLANYMDREALKGWFQGLGIVTSMTSPFMPAAAMGLPQEIYEDTVKPALNTIREKLDENVPGFKDLSAKFDVGVDKVKEQYETRVPATEEILDTVFDAIMGEGKSQEAREFGSNYQLPSGVREAIEVGVEDIAPVPTDIGGVPASEFLNIEPMMLYDPVVDQMPYSPATLEDAIDYSEALERDKDLTEQVNRQLEETVFLDPETFPFPSRPLELPPIPETMAEAMVDQQGREASIARDAMLQGIPVELAAPVTPVEIQQLAPLPEEVDIEQAAFIEPPVVETVSQISPDAMNAALNIVSNMINQPGSVISTDDYLAIQNAETEEEFVEAIQKVIDKDKERGRQLEKESGFVYKRGN